MAEKRRREAGDDQHGSTKRYKDNYNSNGYGGGLGERPWQAKRQTHDDGYSSLPTSSGAARKRVRTIERTLNRGAGKMPKNVQKELTQELARLKGQIEGRQEKKERSRMIRKYHMIRFFERKKAVRLERQLKRRLAETDDPEERARIEADLHIAEIDQLYAAYFPFLEPYVSLYPQQVNESEDKETEEKVDKKAGKKDKKDKKDKKEQRSKERLEEDAKQEKEKSASTAAQALHAPRPQLWTVVETTLEQGGISALERLRDRRPKKTSKSDKDTRQTSNRAAAQQDEKSDDEDSDFLAE